MEESIVSDGSNSITIEQRLSMISKSGFQPSEKFLRKRPEKFSENAKTSNTKISKPFNSVITKAVVQRVKGFYLYVELGRKKQGRIHITEISNTVANGSRPLTVFQRGQSLTVRTFGFSTVKRDNGYVITRAHRVKKYIDCSLRESVVRKKNPEFTRNFVVGDNVIGYVCGYSKSWVTMWLAQDVLARVNVLNLSHSFKDIKNLKKKFKKGHAYSARILGKGSIYYELAIICPEDLKAGAIVAGRILSLRRDLGLLVKLPLSYKGRVHLTDMADEYKHSAVMMTDLLEDSIVKCYIISIDTASRDAVLSLRGSRLGHLKKSDTIVDRERELKDLRPNMEVRGFVSGVTKFRLFVIVGRGICAICPIRPNIPEHLKSVGAVVRIQITKLAEEEEKEGDSEIQGNVLVSEEDELMDSAIVLPEEHPAKSRRREVENHEEEIYEEAVERVKKRPKTDKKARRAHETVEIKDISATVENENQEKAFLQVPSGFVWDLSTVQTEKEDSDSSDDEEGKNKTLAKKKKQSRFLEEKSEEERLRNTELMLLDSSRQPQTVDDFDKMVLSSPNSSLVWLQYMAFHLQSTEFEKARAVAERALKTISFREEQEKLNVWVAFLNLENLYGTPESMQKVFQRALQFNDPLKVYKHVANIYIQADKRDAAEQLYSVMIKKFSTNIEVWVNYGIFLMKNSQSPAAHRLMERSLKSLPKKDHITVISRFAQLEFKYGDPQRGNTLFESMLTSYPKRADIWSVYVDVLVKTGLIDKARDIYKKVLTVAASQKKMKFLFPKFLAFENLHGSEETVNYAREKLTEFEQLNNCKFPIDYNDDE